MSEAGVVNNALIQAWIPRELRAAFQATCKECGVPMTVVIREFVVWFTAYMSAYEKEE